MLFWSVCVQIDPWKITMYPVYIVLSGAQIGTTIQYMTSGFIADAWGWPAIFYVNGATGALWCVMYVFVAAPTPLSSKIISPEEKLYIKTSLDQEEEQRVSNIHRMD